MALLHRRTLGVDSFGKSRVSPVAFLRDSIGGRTWVPQLSLRHRLQQHEGCVNTVNWSWNGEYVASGSDDTHINVYRVGDGRDDAPELVARIDSGHRGNIFCTKFLPFTHTSIVSGAADGEVRHCVVEHGPVHVFRCHTGMVHELALDPRTPPVFLSSSQDGTVRLFDLRVAGSGLRSAASSAYDSPRTPNVLVDLRHAAAPDSGGLGRIPISSIATNPLAPDYFVIACKDPYVRMYDRRMLTMTRGTPKPVTPVEMFAPKRLRLRNSGMPEEGWAEALEQRSAAKRRRLADKRARARLRRRTARKAGARGASDSAGAGTEDYSGDGGNCGGDGDSNGAAAAAGGSASACDDSDAPSVSSATSSSGGSSDEGDDDVGRGGEGAAKGPRAPSLAEAMMGLPAGGSRRPLSAHRNRRTAKLRGGKFKNLGATGVAYSVDGSEIAVTYCGERVYVFRPSVGGGGHVESEASRVAGCVVRTRHTANSTGAAGGKTGSDGTAGAADGSAVRESKETGPLSSREGSKSAEDAGDRAESREGKQADRSDAPTSEGGAAAAAAASAGAGAGGGLSLRAAAAAEVSSGDELDTSKGAERRGALGSARPRANSGDAARDGGTDTKLDAATDRKTAAGADGEGGGGDSVDAGDGDGKSVDSATPTEEDTRRQRVRSRFREAITRGLQRRFQAGTAMMIRALSRARGVGADPSALAGAGDGEGGASGGGGGDGSEDNPGGERYRNPFAMRRSDDGSNR